MKNLLKILSEKKIKFSLFAIGILLVIYAFLLRNEGKPMPQVSNPNASPSISLPTTISPATKSYYDQTNTDKLIQALESPTPLTKTDQLAKQTIINQLNKKSGVIQKTADYILEYVKSSDTFMVEITTVDVSSAKQQVQAWFAANGFSQQSVCQMPVIFYLNYEIANIFRSQGKTFNPLAEGC